MPKVRSLWTLLCSTIIHLITFYHLLHGAAQPPQHHHQRTDILSCPVDGLLRSSVCLTPEHQWRAKSVMSSWSLPTSLLHTRSRDLTHPHPHPHPVRCSPILVLAGQTLSTVRESHRRAVWNSKIFDRRSVMPRLRQANISTIPSLSQFFRAIAPASHLFFLSSSSYEFPRSSLTCGVYLTGFLC